jgi:hypothetical protein
LRSSGISIFAMLAMATLAGCEMARVRDPLTRTLGSSDVNAQFDFWDALNKRPQTCNDDAFHGLILYLDDTDRGGDYDGRVKLLKERRMLPANFDRPADQAVRRGTLAVAVAQILNVKGGLMFHLTGNNERYALLELQDMGVFPISSENQSFSGPEFVGLMGRVDDFRTGERANTPANDLRGAGAPLPP